MHSLLLKSLYALLHITFWSIIPASVWQYSWHLLELFMYSIAANLSVLIYYVILTINMQWILSCMDFLVLLILYCKIILWAGQAVSHKNTISQCSKIKPAATAWLTGIYNRISLADMTMYEGNVFLNEDNMRPQDGSLKLTGREFEDAPLKPQRGAFSS